MTDSDLPWRTDYPLTVEEAASLGRSAFGFHFKEIRKLGEGYDYANFLADNHWVLRFPKREECNTVLLGERKILTTLASVSLPLAIPSFEQVAEPTDNFPWHFAIYPFLPGTPLKVITAAEDLPERIGEFLGALHGAQIDEVFADPWDDDVYDWARHEYESSISAYPQEMRFRVEAYLDDEKAPLPNVPTALAHADLHNDHILIDEINRKPCAIIDWADAHTTIRTSDYIGLYHMGGYDYCDRAFAAAGVVPDDAEWRWLHDITIGVCFGQIDFGYRRDEPKEVTDGLAILDRLLSER